MCWSESHQKAGAAAAGVWVCRQVSPLRRTENTAPGVDAAAAMYKRKVPALSAAAAAVILPCSHGRTTESDRQCRTQVA